MSWQRSAAACGLARAIHEAQCKADERAANFDALPLHVRRLLVEIAVDLLNDLAELPLPEVANERVSHVRRVVIPISERGKR